MCERQADDDGDARNDVIQEAIRNDELRRLERAERQNAECLILLAAKMIAPLIHDNYDEGYDWCIEQVRVLRRLQLYDSTRFDEHPTLVRRSFDRLSKFIKLSVK